MVSIGDDNVFTFCVISSDTAGTLIVIITLVPQCRCNILILIRANFLHVRQEVQNRRRHRASNDPSALLPTVLAVKWLRESIHRICHCCRINQTMLMLRSRRTATSSTHFSHIFDSYTYLFSITNHLSDWSRLAHDKIIRRLWFVVFVFFLTMIRFNHSFCFRACIDKRIWAIPRNSPKISSVYGFDFPVNPMNQSQHQTCN